MGKCKRGRLKDFKGHNYWYINFFIITFFIIHYYILS